MRSSATSSRPGSLKRGLVSHCPDDCSNKRSRTSSLSSLNNTYTGGIPSSIRNAIASSYSSSRGLSQVGNVAPERLGPALGSPRVAETQGSSAASLGAWQRALQGSPARLGQAVPSPRGSGRLRGGRQRYVPFGARRWGGPRGELSCCRAGFTPEQGGGFFPPSLPSLGLLGWKGKTKTTLLRCRLFRWSRRVSEPCTPALTRVPSATAGLR